MQNAKKRINSIDLLRFIAVILITLSHLADPDAIGVPDKNNIIAFMSVHYYYMQVFISLIIVFQCG